jgi:hypothetical protein
MHSVSTEEENELYSCEMTESEVIRYCLSNHIHSPAPNPMDVIRQIKEGKEWLYKGKPIKLRP